MKVKEIEQHLASGTLVAVANYIGRDEVVPSCRRARIDAVRQPRKVYSGARWDFSGHTAQDGVKVTYIDGVGAEGTSDTISARNVWATWDDYQAKRAAHQEARQTEAQRLEATKLKAETAAAKLREAGATSATARAVSQSPGYKIISYRVEMGAGDAERIANMLS